MVADFPGAQRNRHFRTRRIWSGRRRRKITAHHRDGSVAAGRDCGDAAGMGIRTNCQGEAIASNRQRRVLGRPVALSCFSGVSAGKVCLLLLGWITPLGEYFSRHNKNRESQNDWVDDALSHVVVSFVGLQGGQSKNF